MAFVQSPLQGHHQSLSQSNRCSRFFVIVFATLIVGCSGPEVHQAAYLPAEFRAPTRSNSKTVDLGKFGRSALSSDVIDRGDVLEVTISAGLTAEDTVTFPARVDDRGNIPLPVIGKVSVAGLELNDAENTIRASAVQQGLYRNPHITVTMKNRRTNRVVVVGAVDHPGVYQLPRRSSDLLSAIVVAGGLADDASTDVEIRKPGQATPASEYPAIAKVTGSSVVTVGHSAELLKSGTAQVVQIDLASAQSQSNESFAVPDGSIVMVKRRDPQPLHVMGLVNRPNRYEFPVNEDLRVLDAIALAEGVSTPVADKVYVVRRIGNEQVPIVIQVSIRAAKHNGEENVRLAPGDVVSVEQTPATIIMEAIQIIRFGIGATIF